MSIRQYFTPNTNYIDVDEILETWKSSFHSKDMYPKMHFESVMQSFRDVRANAVKHLANGTGSNKNNCYALSILQSLNCKIAEKCREQQLSQVVLLASMTMIADPTMSLEIKIWTVFACRCELRYL